MSASIEAMPEMLTIGELSARSGVASSALRFYEERGLISSERASSGHRRFARPVIRRVAFIVFAQRVGLSLDEIREELVKLPADRAPNRGDWAKLSSSWTGRIDERIAELERPEGGPDRVHRLRLPVAGPLPAGQSRRPRRPPAAPGRATGSATPARRQAASRSGTGSNGCRARSSRHWSVRRVGRDSSVTRSGRTARIARSFRAWRAQTREEPQGLVYEPELLSFDEEAP